MQSRQGRNLDFTWLLAWIFPQVMASVYKQGLKPSIFHGRFWKLITPSCRLWLLTCVASSGAMVCFKDSYCFSQLSSSTFTNWQIRVNVKSFCSKGRWKNTKQRHMQSPDNYIIPYLLANNKFTRYNGSLCKNWVNKPVIRDSAHTMRYHMPIAPTNPGRSTPGRYNRGLDRVLSESAQFRP